MKKTVLVFSVLAEENEEFKTLNVTIDEMKNFAENNLYVEAAFPGYTEPFEGTISINVPNDKITMKDEVEPTATSTPSKVTSPEADDNNTILWISVISGVVIVAAVVVIVTVKKKK